MRRAPWIWPPRGTPWTWPPGGGGASKPPIINDPRLALHLESDYGVTYTGGPAPAAAQLVSEWASRAGWRNTVVQSIEANRPTLVPNVLNGMPAIRFGGSQWLQALAQVGVVTGDLPRMYVMASFAALGVPFDGALANYSNGTVVNTGFTLVHAINNVYWGTHRNGAMQSGPVFSAAGSNSTPVLFDGRNTANNVILAINGLDVLTLASGGPAGLSTTPSTITLGREVPGTFPLVGDVFQVIVLTNPTPELHQFVLDYIANKYPSVPIANTPAKILGSLLHADFDAADSGIVLNGNAVASIPNRGGDSAAMVQGSGQAQPAFSASSFAGGAGITFDGVNDTMACTFATPIPVGRRPYLWMLFKAANTSQTDQIVSIIEAASGARYIVGWSNRSGSAGVYAAAAPGAAGVGNSPNLAPTELVNTHLLEVGDTVNGAGAFVLDGVTTSAGSAAPFVTTDQAMTTLRLAAYGGGGAQAGNCTIRRVIVANDLPSAAQISAMRAYLRAQPYGLTF